MIDPTRLMRGVILALALLFAAPLAGVGGPLLGIVAAQAQTVSRIAISGNSEVDDATIISQLAVRQGETATNAKIAASIDSLYATGLFSNVSVTYAGGTLSVRVSENSIIASVLFEGNKRFSDAQLLAMVNVGARGAFNNDALQTDVESIKQAYADAGFTDVNVTARTEAVDNGRVRVVFAVNEGERAGIAAINFTGNNAINSGTLKGIIRTKESNILSWLFRDDTYDEQKLAVDKELVRLYYANHGFPDAEVSSAVAEYDEGRNAYFINFTVNEGERYTFGAIDVETSIPGLDVNALRGTIQAREGGRYSFEDLQRTAEDMAFAATSQGFAFADVRPRIDRDLANRVLNITFLVDQGPRVYVERINITGNEKTRDFVIRRELDFVEGDPFNRSLVTRGKSSIEALGFFESVSVSTEQGSAPDKVVINIAVNETSTGDYGVTAGYSTDAGILGEVSLTERNFLGRGQYVRLAVGASGSGKTFDFSFTEPRFMGLRISSGIDVYHRISDETSNNYYGVTTTGGQVRFGVPITRELNASLFAGYERKQFVDANAPLTQLFGPAGANGVEFNKAFVGYGLTYNGLDDVKHPTEGLYATLSQQYVGLDHSYIRSEARARYFMPLLEDSGLIASVRGQAGIMNDLSGKGVHPTEAYNLGAGLVRGFERYGPRLVSGEATGYTMYAGLSGEISFPIPMLPESYGLRGAVFADAAYVDGIPGMLEPLIDPLSVDNKLKASVGASLIWDSPFGPIRGDLAYAISGATKDKPQLFQLSLQTLL